MSSTISSQARITHREDPSLNTTLSSDESRDPLVRNTKTKYSAEKLMMMLDKEKLEALEEEFNEHPDGIELHNFVWLMKCAMSVAPEERAELILGLYYLFQEIDINGDEHMEWSEFTQYIIDAVMGQHAKDRNEDKELTASEILELAQSHKSRRYQLSKLRDKSNHVGIVKHINYYPTIDLVGVVEMSANCVKLYDGNSDVKLTVTPDFKREAFVLAYAYSEREYTMVIAGSDRVMYVYEKDVGAFRFLRAFYTDLNHLIIWYFEYSKAWISACDDFSIRQWDIVNGCELMIYRGHSQTIMDAVEVKNPLCIATASMDGKILLWDLNEQKMIGKLKGKHDLGVRSLDYSPDYGGNILSVGYEREIQVWSPEVSISKCYAGKLDGHNCPVISCKFFKGRPVCVSVDEKGNVRLWDVRQFLCLQIISNDKGKIELSKLITVTKHDKFIVAGRRLIWYELLKESAMKTINQDVTPVFADFNAYYLQFIVVTKYDIRIYDSITGRLRKIFTEVLDPKTESELSAFTLDHRHRIILLGDNSGGIRAYNFSNGALMKTIEGDKDISKTEHPTQKLSKVQSISKIARTYSLTQLSESIPATIKEKPKDKNIRVEDSSSEISSLYFCVEDKILIAGSWDSTIRVYDQTSQEESPLMRVMLGGHQGSDITKITYSSTFSLIAAGSSNGLVSIWDFEMGKLEAACPGHTTEMLAIEFLDPYPLMATSGADGLVLIWTVRPFPGKMRYHCIMRIVNASWSITKDMKTVVTSMAHSSEQSQGIIKHKRKRHIRQHKVEGASKLNTFKSSRAFEFRHGTTFKSRDERTSTIKLPPSPYMTVSPRDEASDLSAKEETESDYEWIEDPNIEVVEESDNELVKLRNYLYIGDMRGYIKIWTVDHIAESYGVTLVERSERDKLSYNPRRRDEKNAENDVKFWIKESEKFPLPERIRPEANLLVREFRGHHAAITSLKIIAQPKGFLTCSNDKTFKTWSRQGDPWGSINLLATDPPKHWKFPYDWETKRQNDIGRVLDVLRLIDEKIDFDPNLLPLSNLAQSTAKRRKLNAPPRKPKPKMKKDSLHKRPSTSERVQDIFVKHLHTDEDYEVSEEKSGDLPIKVSVIANRLMKKLEEYDEKNTKDLEASEAHSRHKRDAQRKATRHRKVFEEEAHHKSRTDTFKTGLKLEKPQKIKLPQIMTTGATPTFEDGQSLDKHLSKQLKANSTSHLLSKDQSSQFINRSMNFNTKSINDLHKKRPVLGYDSPSVPVNRLYIERLSNEIDRIKSTKIKGKVQTFQDVKFKPGETLRALNRAISSHTYSMTTNLMPYTDDINSLKKKNNLLKSLTPEFELPRFRKVDSKVKLRPKI
jgi:WD40 repeat protein